jgi:hypothetical protein
MRRSRWLPLRQCAAEEQRTAFKVVAQLGGQAKYARVLCVELLEKRSKGADAAWCSRRNARGKAHPAKPAVICVCAQSARIRRRQGI